ncbi:MAG TPA: hypothetical protein VGD65_20705 [Chryseosolibacter sp.]
MRFTLLPLITSLLFCFSCAESDEPQAPVVQTLDVANSSSSSRKFRGEVEHLNPTDTIVAYGFAWESRYGTWEVKKPGSLGKGIFFISDRTRLSKWSSFTVRAFVETQNGVVYGDVETFSTEDD